MNTIENKSGVTPEELEDAGYEFLISYETIAIFGKGKDRFLYRRISGEEPIYEFLFKYKDNCRGLRLRK